MFGDTLTVGAGTLKRINQDKYSTEYFYRETAFELRCFIRHSSRLDKARNVKVDRHNVEYSAIVYSTDSTPDIVRKAYFVYENDYNDDPSEVAMGVDLGDFMTEVNLIKLVNWES